MRKLAAKLPAPASTPVKATAPVREKDIPALGKTPAKVKAG
jgi:hypothetical protein